MNKHFGALPVTSTTTALKQPSVLRLDVILERRLIDFRLSRRSRDWIETGE